MRKFFGCGTISNSIDFSSYYIIFNTFKNKIIHLASFMKKKMLLLHINKLI